MPLSRSLSSAWLDVLIEVELLQGRLLVGQTLIGEQLFVGTHGRVDLPHLQRHSLFLVDYAYGRGRVSCHVLIFCHAHDTCGIEAVQALYDGRLQVVGDRVAIGGEVLAQVLYLLLLHLSVVAVVGLKGLHQRVLLQLDGFVGLVDGEVKLGDERAVHPWLADIVSYALALVVGQKPHDDGRAGNDKCQTRERSVDSVVGKPYFHVYCICNAFILRKYEK